MVHRVYTTVHCKACSSVPQHQAIHCHECRGRRFIAIEGRGEICDGEEMFDPMVGGWECMKCGGSGPL